ncbi:MAG: glycoside hydrolase family 97 catalytic domain-containing protein [Rikenellaceae bacterium]
MKRVILNIFLLLAVAAQSCSTQSSTSAQDCCNVDGALCSPSGDLKFTFSQQPLASGEGTQMLYSVEYLGEEIVAGGKLGIELECEALQALPQDGTKAKFWGESLTLASIDYTSTNNSWEPLYGERAVIEDNYNQMMLTFADPSGKKPMQIEVRAYDQGVAFSYIFTEDIAGESILINRERTSFTMPKGTQSYFTATAQGYYVKRPLEDWGGREIAERPLTLELPSGRYVALCEAAMLDYARGKFKLATEPYELEVSLEGKVECTAPYQTPWRVVMAAERAADLITNNDITLNLNAESQLEDTSWIQPGKVFRCGLPMDEAMEAVDFALERGCQYIHLDAGWYGPEFLYESDATTTEERFNLDFKKLCQYAQSKGIGVLVYVNHRALESQLDEILPLYKEWGIKGIKFGFVNVGSQEWTKWLHESVRKCAEYGMIVDVHDEYRPTGLTRTYPHWLNQEGIGGNEVMPGATHNTILPFTRMVCGAGDYTFCYFSTRVKNTKAHQLALPVIFYSPLQFMFWYDKPTTYRGEQELEFWAEMPVTWDDSRTIDGEIGEYVVQARKSGDEWFVGAITNTSERKITIDCSQFLEAGATYDVSIYEDDPSLGTRTNVKITQKSATSKEKLTFDLLASGGVSLHFTKK